MGRYKAITFPTPVILAFFESTLKSCTVTRIRFISIKTLPPRTAALFGVMPQVEIRNRMADSAMPLTINVTTDNRKRIQISPWLLRVLEDSAIEKKMSAITPTNNALKINKNSLSL